MKQIAGILIVVSTVVAAIGAVTAYTPTVESLYSFEPENLPTLARPVEMDLVDIEELPLEDRPPLGAPVFVPGREEPVARPISATARVADRLLPMRNDMIARIRGAGVERVTILAPPEDGRRMVEEEVTMLRDAGVERVLGKQFHFEHWTGRWWFMGACLGLMVGGLMLRAEAVEDEPGETGTSHGAGAALRDAAERVRALIAARDAASDTPRVGQIITTLDRVQAECFDKFTGARMKIVGALGMAGYAQLMDSFSGAERQLNRAWSAAADGQLEEAEICLQEGAARLDEAIGKVSRL